MDTDEVCYPKESSRPLSNFRSDVINHAYQLGSLVLIISTIRLFALSIFQSNLVWICITAKTINNIRILLLELQK